MSVDLDAPSSCLLGPGKTATQDFDVTTTTVDAVRLRMKLGFRAGRTSVSDMLAYPRS